MVLTPPESESAGFLGLNSCSPPESPIGKAQTFELSQTSYIAVCMLLYWYKMLAFSSEFDLGIKI